MGGERAPNDRGIVLIRSGRRVKRNRAREPLIVSNRRDAFRAKVGTPDKVWHWNTSSHLCGYVSSAAKKNPLSETTRQQ